MQKQECRNRQEAFTNHDLIRICRKGIANVNYITNNVLPIHIAKYIQHSLTISVRKSLLQNHYTPHNEKIKSLFFSAHFITFQNEKI